MSDQTIQSKAAIDDVWEKLETLKNTHPAESLDNVKEFADILNYLVLKHENLVKIAARNAHRKLKDVDPDDLESWAYDGLLIAIKKYDRHKGVKFETYAMHRIRGAILDNLRSIDWTPRLVRQRAAKLQKIKQEYEANEGRTLSEAELAERLNVPLEDLQENLRRATPVMCVSMFSKATDTEGDVIEFHDVATKQRSPLNKLVRGELFQKLLSQHFTKLEKKIIMLHYIEDLSMKEIANQTNYSESRISQMHTEILARLQKKLERNPEYASDIMCEMT
jgi:RNA polymerase sigma factor for flagellar operon FliA